MREKRKLVVPTAQNPEISPETAVNQRNRSPSEPLELPEPIEYREECGLSRRGKLEASVMSYGFSWRNLDPFETTWDEFRSEFNHAFRGHERSRGGSL